MSGSTRYTVADPLAQKGRRQLIVLYVEPRRFEALIVLYVEPRRFEALLGALGEGR